MSSCCPRFAASSISAAAASAVSTAAAAASTSVRSAPVLHVCSCLTAAFFSRSVCAAWCTCRARGGRASTPIDAASRGENGPARSHSGVLSPVVLSTLISAQGLAPFISRHAPPSASDCTRLSARERA
eukprot:scaffold141478_cov136-Phaeocystis_antarctica.AAC.1